MGSNDFCHCLRTARSDADRVCKEMTKFDIGFIIIIEEPLFVDATENNHRTKGISLPRW